MTQSFEFGDFRLELEERRLFFQGQERSLPPKLFDTLALLVQKPDHLITKDEFLNRLWPETFVGEDTLAQNISLLRKVLSEGANGQEYVATVPRRGYRFVAHVATKPAVGRPVSKSAPSDADHTGHGHKAPKNQAGIVSPIPSESPHLSASRTENRVFRLGWIRIAAVSSIVLSAGVATFLVMRPVAQNQMKALSFVQLTNDAHPKTGPLRTDGTRIYTTEYLPELHGVIVQVSIKGGEITSFSSPLRKPQVADISPDGTELLLMNDELSGPPSLWIQSVIGGDPRRVGELAAEYASWGPDDQTVAYSKSQEIYIAKKDGTLSRKLLTAPGVPLDLKFSPDGTKLRFTLAQGQDKTTSLWEASADGSHPRSLLPDWNAGGSECCGVWTTDGKYYIFQSWQNARREIWAIQENGSTRLRRTRRVPEQVTAGPMDFSYPIAGKDGRELFAIGTLPRAEVVWYDLREHQFNPYLPGISAEGLDFSQDGKWVTYASYPEATLWRSRIDGSDRRQLTFPPMRVFLPRWSPDGKQIAFLGGPPGGRWKLGGPWKIYLISIDGGSPQQLLPGETNESVFKPAWFSPEVSGHGIPPNTIDFPSADQVGSSRL